MPEGVGAPAPLTGVSRAAERVFLVALTAAGGAWALRLQDWLPWALFKEQYLALFLALALGAAFLAARARAGAPRDRVPWPDWLLSAGGLMVGGYVVVWYPTIAYQLGVLTWDKVALGGLAVLLILEATRRLVGWPLVWIALAAVLYAKLAFLFPGLLYARGASWGRLAVYLYLDANGLFGVPLSVAASIVVAFVLLGQVLYAVGGDRFLTDLALVAMGRYRGGPAKVAVVSSTLFGTVSGSAVANVAVDGAITIPMMKRAGYPPHLAAAIEAVASNGGQLMPPVMGAAAFLIAEYLGLSYGEVALAAAAPALLYYLALFVQVDLEAAKHGLAGLPADEVPRLRSVVRHGGVFVVPLAVLIYTLMVAAWEPGRAGMAAVGATLAVGVIQTGWSGFPRRVLDAVEGAGRTMLDLVAITALAGLVIGALQLSGFTAKLPILLTTAAGGHALGLLALSALACVVLGMSLPTTVVYVTLAVLVAPALTQLGIVPLAAHLFLFYFGMLSLITPPNCLATYAAAAMARADFWRTGWTGMRLGIVAYIVPFVFALQPALIGRGSAAEIAAALATAAVGVSVLGAACAGHLFRPLRWGRRACLAVAGVALIPTPASPAWLAVNLGGLALGAGVVGWEWGATRPRPAPLAPVNPHDPVKGRSR